MDAGSSVVTVTTMFPSKGVQVLSCLIYILGTSILTHCLSRRLLMEEWSGVMLMPWARICALLVFVDSWLFLFTSCILVFGIGLESKELVCAMGIYICIIFYATSKILIYSFLIEKVYLVWSPSADNSRRLKSPIYIGCMVMLGIYSVVIALMIAGRIHFFDGEGICIIGLQRYSSFTLLAYDLLINVVLTVLFLWPVLRANLANPRLKSVAIRTLVASAVALTTSTVNILVLSLLHGHERGWVCLGSCGADVIFNALAIFWVTSRGSSEATSSQGNTRKDRRAPEFTVTAGDSSTSFVLRGPPRQPAPSRTSRIPWPFISSFTRRSASEIELEPRSQIASVVKSVKGLFRNDQAAERTVQVTVTTDFHIDDDIEAKVYRSDEFEENYPAEEH
ncbi:hypothetical protein BDP27DRAFT_1309489 [Rhodocollybia butyracea]|uniref:Transmembrane protein n=1 Tax=Rhodocollybia butyracea TaxID=206335 RepID=A0A9P5QBM3_9AGAR|nr:hypothetical protein BDP27DRAFT_1309489 [Rhodocollybia butyracea]